MSNVKCSNCGLYNFAEVTECRRCMQPLSHQPIPQTTSYLSYPPVAENTSAYATTYKQAEEVFPPPGSWAVVTNDTATEHFEDREPFFLLFGFLLVAMVFCTGIPPDIQYIAASLSVFHIGIFLFTLYGVGKWSEKLHQTGSAQKYSGKIRGFLIFPAMGMIVHCLVTLWMSAECRSAADKLTKAIETQRRLIPIKDFLDLTTIILLVMSILFVIALVFFYLKHKLTPFICTIVLLLHVAGFIFINYWGWSTMESLPDSMKNRQLDSSQASEYSFLLFIGGLCMLINFIAFISYFMISKRVRATFVDRPGTYKEFHMRILKSARSIWNAATRPPSDW